MLLSPSGEISQVSHLSTSRVGKPVSAYSTTFTYVMKDARSRPTNINPFMIMEMKDGIVKMNSRTLQFLENQMKELSKHKLFLLSLSSTKF